MTLGRQYDSVVDYLGPLALTGTQYGGTQFAHPFDNDNLDNSFRINNSVKYQSANYAGFKFGALVWLLEPGWLVSRTTALTALARRITTVR